MNGLLPTGMATLLLADVEGSTRAVGDPTRRDDRRLARLNQTVSEVIAAHDGVRPVEQGEGDSFVAAFARASDAVACALELQRAPLAPIRLRVGCIPAMCLLKALRRRGTWQSALAGIKSVMVQFPSSGLRSSFRLVVARCWLA